jgi:hypothetical protein
MARARLNARPRPLKSAATRLARILGVAGSLVTALAGWGLITVLQQDALTGLLGAIPGAVTAVTAVLTAFGVVRRAEPLVTPISSPQNNAGQDLVPASVAGDFGSGLGT